MEIIGVERINKIIEGLFDFEVKQKEFKNVIYINYGLNLISKNGIKIFVRSLIQKKKLIVHWIGSDVYTLLGTDKKSQMKCRLLKLISKFPNVHNWSAAPLLKSELKSIGINSEYVVVPSELIKDFSIEPLPDNNEFITYLPKQNHLFYQSDIILDFFSRRPDLKLHVVANDGVDMPKYSNVIYHGYVSEQEMHELYLRTRGVIRIPIHDALGGTVLEAVNRGRYAIWTYKANYVFTSQTIEELSEAIELICKKKKPNFEGAEYVKSTFSYSILKKQFIQMLREVNKIDK